MHSYSIARQLSKHIVALLIVAFSLPTFGFAYVGFFARYAADDFCTATTLFARGFIGAEQFWYVNWSGRLVFFALIDALEWLGQWTVPLTPIVLLTAWVAASAAAISPLLAVSSSTKSCAQSVLLALVLVSVTLGGAPSLWQTLYWQTGAVSYLVPIILATLYVRTLRQAMHAWRYGRTRKPWLLVGGLVVVLTIGSSETAMIVLGGGLALACLVTLRLYKGTERRALLATLGVGLAAALFAGAVVIAAPGNALRASVYAHPGLDLVVFGSIWYPFWLLFNFVWHTPALAVLAYAVPYVVSRLGDVSATPLPRRRLAMVRRLLMLATFPVIALTAAPTLYIGGGLPPDRAQIVPLFALVVVLMISGFLDGLGSGGAAPTGRQPWQRAVLAVGLCASIALGPLMLTVRTLSDGIELKAYAATLDDMDRQARNAHTNGEPELHVQRVKQPELIGLQQLGPDAGGWPNTCVAAYYGLESITAVEGVVEAP